MTMHAQASKLDMDNFAKVHRLMTEGVTAGESAFDGLNCIAVFSSAGKSVPLDPG